MESLVTHMAPKLGRGAILVRPQPCLDRGVILVRPQPCLGRGAILVETVSATQVQLELPSRVQGVKMAKTE